MVKQESALAEIKKIARKKQSDIQRKSNNNTVSVVKKIVTLTIDIQFHHVIHNQR